MRTFLLILLVVFISSCITNSKIAKSSNRLDNHVAANYSTHSILPQEEIVLEKEQSLESLGEEQPLYALLEADSNSAIISEFEHNFSEKEKINQRIKTLKEQLKKSPVYVIPSDTLKSEFDRNYELANTYGIISFAGALLSLFPAVAFFLAIPSFILSILSLKRYKKSFNKKNKILPIIALIISSIWLFLAALVILVLLVLFATYGGW